jgi:hypothetical protein
MSSEYFVYQDNSSNPISMYNDSKIEQEEKSRNQSEVKTNTQETRSRNQSEVKTNTQETKTHESNQDILFGINPIFNILGINTQPTYADVAASEPSNLFNLQFSNNVVTRETVQTSMYNILEEIDNLRDNISENTYLNLSNQLRTVYDYIAQNDMTPITEWPPLNSNRRQRRNNNTRPRMESIFSSQIIQENEGARNLAPLKASLYNLLKWVIRDAPFNRVWQILLLLLLFNLSIIFILIGTIFKIFQKIVNQFILKKILYVIILFAEEVLLSETIQGMNTYRNILLECIRLGRITLNW